MTKASLEDVLRSASTEVLETMFFADAIPPEADQRTHSDALACSLLCSGAEEGIFTTAIDRAALQNLCEAFYGDEGPPSLVKERELLCELTNMLAGSTLSAYDPEHYCPLSSPLLCDLDRHNKTAQPGTTGVLQSTVLFAIDGGLLSISCALKLAA